MRCRKEIKQLRKAGTLNARVTVLLTVIANARDEILSGRYTIVHGALMPKGWILIAVHHQTIRDLVKGGFLTNDFAYDAWYKLRDIVGLRTFSKKHISPACLV